MFKLINICIEAKEAWEILKTTSEGTSKVRMSRLQLFTREFENLNMKEDGTIFNFNIILHDIANNYFSLEEKMSEDKLVRKILQSLT